jgi:sulfur-oxidizing protein SoxZ
MRIRAQLRNDVTEIHVLMPHPMETGFHKDADGDFIPAHYITDIRIELADRPVLSGTLSRAVSEDPLLHCRVQGGRLGDRVRVWWTDTHGETRTDEAVVTAA